MTAADSAPSTAEQETADGQESLNEAIRRRAYEISQSADAGTPQENWARAERELAPEA